MAPRPIGELISYVTSTDNKDELISRFSGVMKEIFSYPRETIKDNLVHIPSNHTTDLRAHLYEALTCDPSPDLKAELTNLNVNDDNKHTLLCKRYNETKSYDDIYLLGISTIENSLHKDFKNLISPSTRKKKSITTSHPTNTTTVAASSSFSAVVASGFQPNTSLTTCNKNYVVTPLASIPTEERGNNVPMK